MKAINNARAIFLFENFAPMGFEISIVQMIKKLFASEPSFTEQTICNSCTHSNSKKFPLVSLNNLKFSNDFPNLEEAVMESFPKNLSCGRCKNDIECKHEFGPHMFIEVINKTGKFQ